MGLYTPAILSGNSYLSWFYDRGAIKDRAHTGTSKGLSQAINGGPIRKFLPKYANVYATIQTHGLSSGARTHYVTASGVRNGLRGRVGSMEGLQAPAETLYHRDDALLYIAYVMLIWAAPIPADRCHCSLWP